jgi:hypothetical protein
MTFFKNIYCMFTEFFKSQINDMVNYDNIAHKFVLNRIIFVVFLESAVSSLLILSFLNRSAKKVKRSQSFDSRFSFSKL